MVPFHWSALTSLILWRIRSQRKCLSWIPVNIENDWPGAVVHLFHCCHICYILSWTKPLEKCKSNFWNKCWLFHLLVLHHCCVDTCLGSPKWSCASCKALFSQPWASHLDRRKLDGLDGVCLVFSEYLSKSRMGDKAFFILKISETIRIVLPVKSFASKVVFEGIRDCDSLANVKKRSICDDAWRDTLPGGIIDGQEKIPVFHIRI